MAAEWQLREEVGTELFGDPRSLSVISINWLLSHQVPGRQLAASRRKLSEH